MSAAIACFLAHDACCKKGEELLFRGMADGKPDPKEDEKRRRRMSERHDDPVHNETRNNGVQTVTNDKSHRKCSIASNDEHQAEPDVQKESISDDSYVVEVCFSDNGDNKWKEIPSTRSSDRRRVADMASDIMTTFSRKTRVVHVTRKVCRDDNSRG